MFYFINYKYSSMSIKYIYDLLSCWCRCCKDQEVQPSYNMNDNDWDSKEYEWNFDNIYIEERKYSSFFSSIPKIENSNEEIIV